MENLKTIARKHKPIKKYLRQYIERYVELFEPLRDKKLTILEIGIGGYKDPNKGGGSLKMWADYFPNSLIIGVDINVKTLQMQHNVSIHCGSQIDEDLLNNLADHYGGFDIVIDDASHMTEYTIKSFEILWKHTRQMYIVEDLYLRSASGTTEYFQGIKESDFSTLNMCVLKK